MVNFIQKARALNTVDTYTGSLACDSLTIWCCVERLNYKLPIRKLITTIHDMTYTECMGTEFQKIAKELNLKENLCSSENTHSDKECRGMESNYP